MPENSGTGGQVIYFSTKQAEEVGFDKFAKRQAALQGIHVLVLDHMCMRAIDRESEREMIGENCKEITDLDLSRNLFESLDEIFPLLSLFPKLRNVVLDGNRLQVDGQDATQRQAPAVLDHVTSLSLSDTLLRWSEIACVTKSFPAITKLSAANNGLTWIGTEHLPQSLEELDLSGNAFLATSDLENLSSYPNLRTLLIKHNPLGLMKHDRATPNFQIISDTIEHVDLAYNAMSSWPSVDSLADSFPALKHLRVTGNPLYKDLTSAEGKALTAEDGYMLTIARLPQLQTLNYSKITEKERLNAEAYYLNQIATELARAPAERAADIQARHPRWKALCEEYGEPAIARGRRADEIDPDSLAARLVTCNFHLARGVFPQIVTERSWTVEIPKSFNLYAVFGMVGKTLGVMPLRLRLVWETGEHDPVARDSGYDGPEAWDSSDDSDGSDAEAGGSRKRAEYVEREVELVAGTRALGTYVEGGEARVRVELAKV
jgi:hypothetical protein